MGRRERGREEVSVAKEDKFIEVDNCIVPGTLQEHIRLLGRRDFGISLPFRSWPDARGCCFLSS